jgi:DNA invertase Pin-like site-specific DNA recombinase
MFNMLGAIAEFETELRKERQMEGIAKAKERGVYIGRKAKLSEGQVRELKAKREAGAEIKALMAEFDLSRASVYRLLGAEA